MGVKNRSGLNKKGEREGEKGGGGGELSVNVNIGDCLMD